jgi:hypothetical protein
MCWYCGTPIEQPEPIGRSARCPDCSKDLRSCRNCRFFAPGSRGDCRESVSEPVFDKERANFCDWFSLDPAYRARTPGDAAGRSAASSARTSFDALFGG